MMIKEVTPIKEITKTNFLSTAKTYIDKYGWDPVDTPFAELSIRLPFEEILVDRYRVIRKGNFISVELYCVNDRVGCIIYDLKDFL